MSDSSGPVTGTRPLWWDTAASGGPTASGASGDLPHAVDVAVVGGGFTGLWTAYYLAGQQPDL